jgi:hypothetical protein
MKVKMSDGYRTTKANADADADSASNYRGNKDK